MTAQISPNRMEVSDRFPMLGFAVRTSRPDVEAEVVIANDIALFSPQNRQLRNAANFYTSAEHGTLRVPRGDGVFVVPPEVLARFIGSEKLYFGLATGSGSGGAMQVDALPREGSPYVSLRGFTGRTLRRGFGGMRASAPRLEWTGDQPRPGSETAPPAARPAPAPASVGGEGGGAPLPPVPYDDGFGPMPEIPARESALRPARALGALPGRVSLTLEAGTTAESALAWLRRMIEQGVQAAGSQVSPPAMVYLGENSGTFTTVWQAVFGVTALISPVNAFLAAVPELARRSGVTLSIGPALDTPLFGGGIGAVFAPDGQAALFGQGEISADFEGLTEFAHSLKLALAAKIKLGYNSGGLASFANIGTVASVMVGEEFVGGAEVWLDSAGHGIGGAVSIGVGFALQLAAQQEAQDALVRPATGEDPRARATRIGGAFAPRIHEALDTGLDPAALQRLLDTLDPPTTAKPLGAMLGSPNFSIHWDGVNVIGQPTNVACWATAAAMLIGWRDQVSISPETIARQCGLSINQGLDPAAVETVAAALGLTPAPAACYTPDAFRTLIENHGPLWVGKMMGGNTGNAAHAVLVVGMYSDESDIFLRIADPWDRQPGTPGAPENYPTTHQTGSSYIMRYADFQAEYEMLPALAPSANVLILHGGVPAGRAINRSLAAPAGFAMSLSGSAPKLAPPPPPQVRAMGAAEIAGIAVEVISSASGDIKTNLTNWPGVKHPRDQAPASEAAYQAGEIELRDWPVVGGTFGVDDIYCWLKIRWQYNGTSLGRIYIDDIGHDDAAGWGLTVTTTIEDDSRLYARSSQARAAGAEQVPALHININYVFDEVLADDQVANTRVSLFADGTHQVESRWVQHSRPGGGNPTHAVRPFEAA
ncbi:papain-like cysteine protease family protein [Erythrobacter sp. NE805]|uniref:papain-like cysteine protease family protein n=1 Tax=Erythrobacter sp. NE805 TaxID=3389875 RepID=UPI00396B20A5